MRVVVGGTPVMFEHGRVPALVPPKLRSSDLSAVAQSAEVEGGASDVATRSAGDVHVCCRCLMAVRLVQLTRHLDHRSSKARAFEQPLRGFVPIRRGQHHAWRTT